MKFIEESWPLVSQIGECIGDFSSIESTAEGDPFLGPRKLWSLLGATIVAVEPQSDALGVDCLRLVLSSVYFLEFELSKQTAREYSHPP
jgi:hypothetical protein